MDKPPNGAKFSYVSFSHPTGTHIRKTLTGWVTPATDNNSPQIKRAFTLKGSAMKKYIPVDFDEKGNAVLGRERNTPTSNGFIPTTWAPGGGGEGNGIKSITISPAISTTPALEEVVPCYYQGSPESHKITANWGMSATYTITATPTPDWYVYTDDDNGEIGQPFEFTLTTDEGGTITDGGNFGVSSQDDIDYIEFSLVGV